MSHKITTAGDGSFQTLMGASNRALAQDGPEALPLKTSTLGNAAIEAAANYVLSCFDDGAPLNGEEMDRLLEMFNLLHLKSQLHFDDRFPDIASFITEVVRCTKLNPILVAFGAAWSGLPLRAGKDRLLS